MNAGLLFVAVGSSVAPLQFVVKSRHPEPQVLRLPLVAQDDHIFFVGSTRQPQVHRLPLVAQDDHIFLVGNTRQPQVLRLPLVAQDDHIFLVGSTKQPQVPSTALGHNMAKLHSR